MILKIKVHPNSRKEHIKPRGEDSFEIFVRAKPVEGKANEAVLELLSEHLRIPRNKLRLMRGATSRNKLVEKME